MAYLERGFDCWNRRAIDEMMDMYAPDAEVDLTRLLPDEGVLHGREQISAHYDRMWETWSGFRWKPKEVADLGTTSPTDSSREPSSSPEDPLSFGASRHSPDSRARDHLADLDAVDRDGVVREAHRLDLLRDR
jgi:hypothetical protein